MQIQKIKVTLRPDGAGRYEVMKLKNAITFQTGLFNPAVDHCIGSKLTVKQAEFLCGARRDFEVTVIK
jgi:hypothetical protein